MDEYNSADKTVEFIYDSASDGEVEEDDSDLDPDFYPSSTDEENENDTIVDPDIPGTSGTNQSKRKRSKEPGMVTDAELGWSPIDTLPPLPSFEEHSGVSAPLDETSTPLDCFLIFFPAPVVKLIKHETNKYAASIVERQRRANKLKKNSMWSSWVPAKLQEIYLFFAIVIHMCLVKKPRLRDYWSKSAFISTQFAPSIMSRNRFSSILANLHINDNRTCVPRNEVGHDPLHKIRPYFDHLCTAFSSSFIPYANLTVDEGMCGFRGRIIFRVYMKNKPEKYGIKLFVVCDSSTGYVLKMEVYTGKGAADNSILELLKRILADYFDKGYTVYMDRFYSSPVVFDYLWQRKTKAVGTCMPNRKELPKDAIVRKKIKKQEMVYMRRNHLLCIKWKDTRDVLVLSTAHQATCTEKVVRTKEGQQTKSKPDAILDYNLHKTGVDRNDQLIAYYPFKRKQLKWWKKLFFHLFVMSIVNAFILFKETRRADDKKRCHLATFMQELGEELVKKGGAENENADVGSATNTNRLTGRHFPDKIPPTEKKSQPTRICKVCSEKGKAETGKATRRETCWWCSQCQVALCIPGCFRLYHTKGNYVK